MIDPKELRLGNCVIRHLYEPDRIITDHQINMEDFYWFLESGGDAEYWIDNFHPIPLTEEWLLRFNMYRIGMNKLHVINSSLYLECAYELKYVHQLQNLYFALIGKELTLPS